MHDDIVSINSTNKMFCVLPNSFTGAQNNLQNNIFACPPADMQTCFGFCHLISIYLIFSNNGTVDSILLVDAFLLFHIKTIISC